MSFNTTGTSDLTYDELTTISTTISPTIGKVKNRTIDIGIESEWAKFREEFIRELLSETPVGLINFEMNRIHKSEDQRTKVKVILEYFPTKKVGARD